MKKLNIAALTAMSLFLTANAFANSSTVSVNVSCTILPLFEMEVISPVNGIEFGAIQKNASADVQAAAPEIQIRAKTNLGQPYIIKHELVAPLANTNGSTLPEGSMSVDATSGKGSSVQGQAVGTSSETLYQSNAGGQSDTITARYNLNVAPNQDAGDYRSTLLYTIVTA